MQLLHLHLEQLHYVLDDDEGYEWADCLEATDLKKTEHQMLFSFHLKMLVLSAS